MTHATMARDVATGSHADVLDAVMHPETALAIWRRDLPPALCEALAMLDLDGIDDIAAELDADTPCAPPAIRMRRSPPSRRISRRWRAATRS